jgi:hypothetical protein
MPFDPDDPFDPTDPAQWARIRAIPHITVHPKEFPDPPPSDGIDDWFVPPSSAAPGTGQPSSGAQLGSAGSGSFFPAGMPPDPFAAFWSPIPASRIGAMAWDPPNLPLFSPPPANNFPAPIPSWPPMLPGSRPLTLGVDPPSWSSPQPPIPALPQGGFLSSLATLGTSPQPTGWGHGFLSSLATLGASPQPPGFGTGFLSSLATLGTSSSAPPAPSLAGGPVTGTGSPTTPPMPSTLQTFYQGLGAATRQLGQTATLGTSPQPSGWGSGFLSSLATLGTSSAAPSAPSLAGSSPGTGSPATPPMPSMLQAFYQGLGAATRQLGQTLAPGAPSLAAQDSPAAEPLGWSDLANPLRIAPKVAYQFAQSSPTLAGGVALGVIGGDLGALAGPGGAAVGAVVGGSLGAAALSAAQTLGPAYTAELQKTPNDPEGAWSRAWKQAEISGAFSGASWAVFPARFFQGPVKHLVFQIFGAQPALAVGERVTRNVVEGRPATEGVGEAYGQGVVGGLTPALGHKVVSWLSPKRAPAADSKTSRGVWDLPATKRGRILEKIFGHNLHPDHPTIDIWDQSTGAATSIKSIDLESPTYQVSGKNVNALYNKLGNAVDDLAEYTGGRYASVQIAEHEIASRTLTVIVPGMGTAGQRQVLRQIAELGRKRGVIVRIEVYR